MAWEPQPGPQSSALLADWCDELFYGGERGGGKSDFQLGYQEDGALRYEGKSRGIMFRKTYAELEELQGRASELFPASGAQYKTQPSAGFPFSNCWYWPNGATVKMRFIEHERDYGRYHGHSYSHQSFDEVTEYATPAGLVKMLSTLRNAHGVPCTMRATGNPGGIGHGWVKDRYISPTPPLTPYHDPDSGFTRMFVPSKTSDNQILLQADPKYRDRIKAATGGNEALRKAWLQGDWNIVAGAFFDCWDLGRHVIRPFEIPEHWMRFRSGDWGSARPFSFGWWAIVSDDYKTEEGLTLPRGCMVRYREWYGVARDAHGQIQYNTGLKLTAEAVGAGIAERERKDPRIDYGVLDPAAFARDGGPSIEERMNSGAGGGQIWRRADNARVPARGAMGGWDQMRARMIGEAEDRPMVVCFSTCGQSIRTIPVLQHDKDRLEDLDTDGEDHCFAAGTMVDTDRGPVAIELLPECGRVLSVGGKYESYRSARMVKRDAALVKLTFDSGVQILCTPDHKFLVDTDEWRYAEDLNNTEVLCSQSSLAQRSKSLMVSGITYVAGIFRAKVCGFISECGNTTMAQFQRVSTSTTRMRTGQTTPQQTSNASLCRSILAEGMAMPVASAQRRVSTKHVSLPQHGMDPMLAKPGILATTPSTSNQSWMRAFQRYASNVARNIRSALPRSSKASIAATTARRVRCVSVEKAGRADVYCLTVPSTATFAIEGGILVSNCADEWRYGCMSRPWVKPNPSTELARFPQHRTMNEIIARQTRRRTEE